MNIVDMLPIPIRIGIAIIAALVLAVILCKIIKFAGKLFILLIIIAAIALLIIFGRGGF